MKPTFRLSMITLHLAVFGFLPSPGISYAESSRAVYQTVDHYGSASEAPASQFSDPTDKDCMVRMRKGWVHDMNAPGDNL
ncbi:MAG: hypothetical protein AAB425_03975, partial [Bdellovibrionota bacterium]